jgi:cytosine deaminase
MPPIEMLRAAGVLVFAGNDDIRDTWSPYGTGDLLERAAMIGWKGDFRRDDQIEVAFDLVSTAGARALGIGDYGITAGSPATLLMKRPRCAIATTSPNGVTRFCRGLRPLRINL